MFCVLQEADEAIAAGKAACEQNTDGNINFNSVIEKLKKLKNMPCHLFFSETSNKRESYRQAF